MESESECLRVSPQAQATPREIPLRRNLGRFFFQLYVCFLAFLLGVIQPTLAFFSRLREKKWTRRTSSTCLPSTSVSWKRYCTKKTNRLQCRPYFHSSVKAQPRGIKKSSWHLPHGSKTS